MSFQHGYATRTNAALAASANLVTCFGIALAAMLGVTGCGSEPGTPLEETAATHEANEAGVQGEMAITPPANVVPVHFELAGDEVHITYTRFPEGAALTYEDGDSEHAQTFLGTDLQSVSGEAGTLVTVFLNPESEPGTLTFSVLIPPVDPPAKGSRPVATSATTTTYVPGFGQVDTVTRLNGFVRVPR